MNAQTWKRLNEEFSRFPVMKATDVPSAAEIHEAEQILGCTFSEDYKEFLRRYGGATVGSLPIFGLRPALATGSPWHIVELTQRYRAQNWPGVDNWYIISEDGFGNPIGIATDGKVMISDHDAGDITVLAQDFEDFLLNHCLRYV